MAYKIRRSSERKYIDHDWLKTYHTFSFGSYYDPKFRGFRDLRVINEDRVAPGQGFSPHEHQDMEIISFVIEGELTHQDSAGHTSILKANEVQVMSAGYGVTHSEYNLSIDQAVHFLQIWIIPDTQGVAPYYQHLKVPTSSSSWFLIASKEGRDQSVKIHQDIDLYFLSLDKEKNGERHMDPARYGWIQVIQGELKFEEEILRSGDGVALSGVTSLSLHAVLPSKILFFDLV